MDRLELARAESEPLAFEARLRLPAGAGSEDVVFLGEAEVAGELVKTSRGFAISGTVRGTARLHCARCLKEFPFELDETLELQLLPASLAPEEEEFQLAKHELEVRFYDAPEVNLVELVIEQLHLAVPMKPLCRRECAGLCPHCGADLNLGRCACPQQIDEKWTPPFGWRPGKQ